MNAEDLTSSIPANTKIAFLSVHRYGPESLPGLYLRASPGGQGATVDIGAKFQEWEQFTLVPAEDGKVGIKSVHGTYLRAWPNGSPGVVDDKVDLQVDAGDWKKMPWEQFKIYRAQDGKVTIMSTHGTFLRAWPNGKRAPSGGEVDLQILTSSGDWTLMPWAQFTIVPLFVDTDIPLTSTLSDVLPPVIESIATKHAGMKLSKLDDAIFSNLVGNCLKHISNADVDIEKHIQAAKEFIHGSWDTPQRTRLIAEDHAAFHDAQEKGLAKFDPHRNLLASESERHLLIVEIAIDSVALVLSMLGMGATIGRKCARSIVTPIAIDGTTVVASEALLNIEKDLKLFASSSKIHVAYGVFKICGGLFRFLGVNAFVKAIAHNLMWYDAIMVVAVMMAQWALWFNPAGEVAFCAELVLVLGSGAELGIDVQRLIDLDK
jgi:hypothetical protein